MNPEVPEPAAPNPAAPNPAVAAFGRRFGVAHPIANAPMAHVAGGALAAAVTRAGGLGLIGGGYGDQAWIEAQIGLAAGAPVGLGLITWAVDDRLAVIDRAGELGVTTFLFSFGRPGPAIERVRGGDGRVLCQVQSVADALDAVGAGADAIVAQGREAGGHGRDDESLHRLLPAVVEAVAPVPVLAAGGLATGADLAAAWEVGAAGVLLGTRMYATPEALDTAAAKERLVASGSGSTVRTRVFDLIRGPEWPAGHDGRAITNDLTARWHGNEVELVAELDAARERYRRAAAGQDLGERVVCAGTGLDEIGDVRPAADLVRSIARDAAAIAAQPAG